MCTALIFFTFVQLPIGIRELFYLGTIGVTSHNILCVNFYKCWTLARDHLLKCTRYDVRLNKSQLVLFHNKTSHYTEMQLHISPSNRFC